MSARERAAQSVLKRYPGGVVRKREVIDLTLSEEESDTERPVKRRAGGSQGEKLAKSPGKGRAEGRSPQESHDKDTQSPLKIMYNPQYDQNLVVPDSVTLHSLIGLPSIRKCWLFSFQFDLAFILGFFANPQLVDLTIVFQEGTVINSPLHLKKFRNVTMVGIQMAPYTCHHSKLIVNIFEDNSMQISIPSFNFTQGEVYIPNQMCWTSPRLVTGDRDTGEACRFKQNLLRYLAEGYDQRLRHLSATIQKYNFGPLVGTDFVYTVPKYSENAGYIGLYNSLQAAGLVTGEHGCEYIVQTSSIASPIKRTKDLTANVFTHLLLPLVLGKTTPETPMVSVGGQSIDSLVAEYGCSPQIVYPTRQDVAESKFGYHAGGWLHFNTTNPHVKKMYEMLHVRGIFRRPSHPVRGSNPSHTKLYICRKAATLKWCLYSTSNLSANAWGRVPNVREKQPTPGCFGKNYEVGVLLARPQNLCLPFTLPAPTYGYGDEPWCVNQVYKEADVNGNVHNGL